MTETTESESAWEKLANNLMKKAIFFLSPNTNTMQLPNGVDDEVVKIDSDHRSSYDSLDEVNTLLYSSHKLSRTIDSVGLEIRLA